MDNSEMKNFENLLHDADARQTFLRDSDAATLLTAARIYFRKGFALRTSLYPKSQRPELEACLRLCCTFLQNLGERRQKEIGALTGKKREALYNQYHSVIKSFTQALHCSDSLFVRLRVCSRDELLEYAIHGAVTFGGGNPEVEKDSDKHRVGNIRLHAFEITLRAMSELDSRG